MNSAYLQIYLLVRYLSGSPELIDATILDLLDYVLNFVQFLEVGTLSNILFFGYHDG